MICGDRVPVIGIATSWAKNSPEHSSDLIDGNGYGEGHNMVSTSQTRTTSRYLGLAITDECPDEYVFGEDPNP